jgi:hypothetical protein
MEQGAVVNSVQHARGRIWMESDFHALPKHQYGIRMVDLVGLPIGEVEPQRYKWAGP